MLKFINNVKIKEQHIGYELFNKKAYMKYVVLMKITNPIKHLFVLINLGCS